MSVWWRGIKCHEFLLHAQHSQDSRDSRSTKVLTEDKLMNSFFYSTSPSSSSSCSYSCFRLVCVYLAQPLLLLLVIFFSSFIILLFYCSFFLNHQWSSCLVPTFYVLILPYSSSFAGSCSFSLPPPSFCLGPIFWASLVVEFYIFMGHTHFCFICTCCCSWVLSVHLYLSYSW